MDSLDLTGGQVSLSVVFLASCVTFSFAKRCGYFEFPNLLQPLTAVEGVPLVIPFRLNTEGCTVRKGFSVHVEKRSSKGYINVLCIFHHENGTCVGSAGKGCSCPDKHGGLYTFQKDIVRADDSIFLWKTDQNHIAKNAKITLKVISVRPSVKSLTISGHQDSYLAKKGDHVDIFCEWENGNPTVTARLLDKEGKELSYSNRSGQIRYRLAGVGCQDAGSIHCIAPGASHNMTARLLFTGPPEFDTEKTTVYSAGKHAQLRFRVCAHTKTLRTCHLTRLAKNEIAQDCSGYTNITGTPPDLTLNVLLDDVRKEKEGLWRLELTTDGGTGHVEFELIALDTHRVEQGAMLVRTEPWVWTLVGIACTASVKFIVAVIVRRHCHDRRVRGINEPDAVAERISSRRPSDVSHIYHEPNDVSSDNDNEPCILPHNYLTCIPDIDVNQGQGNRSPDRPQPGASSENDQTLLFPTEQSRSPSSPMRGEQIRRSHTIRRESASPQDRQQPTTSRAGQHEASFHAELLKGPGARCMSELSPGAGLSSLMQLAPDFIKQRPRSSGPMGPQPGIPSESSALMPGDQSVGSEAKHGHCSTKRGFRQPDSFDQGFDTLTDGANKRQDHKHPPKRCWLPAPKGSLNPHDGSEEAKILSVLKSAFGPDDRITDVRLEGKEIHVTRKLNVEQV